MSKEKVAEIAQRNDMSEVDVMNIITEVSELTEFDKLIVTGVNVNRVTAETDGFIAYNNMDNGRVRIVPKVGGVLSKGKNVVVYRENKVEFTINENWEEVVGTLVLNHLKLEEYLNKKSTNKAASNKTKNSQKADKAVSGTNEWSTSCINYIQGCSNQCKYCFGSAMGVQYGRVTPSTWGVEVVNEKRLEKKYNLRKGRIMFPSTHDISVANLKNSIDVLRKILIVGNEVLIVSKPHFEVIEKLCEEFKDYKDKILFRFSIGSIDTDILKFWEPFAPNYSERKKCLEYAFQQGFQTSVSAEPYLDKNTVDLVNDLQDCITDSIWIGKVNKLKSRLKMNGHTDALVIQRADELIEFQSDANVRLLYGKLHGNSKVKWKESIKKVVNIPLLTVSGLDI